LSQVQQEELGYRQLFSLEVNLALLMLQPQIVRAGTLQMPVITEEQLPRMELIFQPEESATNSFLFGALFQSNF